LSARIKATWEFDPLLVVVSPLIILFYGVLVVGPPIAVFLLPRPSFVVGIPALLMALGVIARIFVEGFWARRLAVASRDLGGEYTLHYHSWAIVLRALVATAWLIPVIGLWASALENHLDPTTASVSLDYTWLNLWEVAGVVPLLEIPQTLGFPVPPVTTWTLGTGIAILGLKIVVLYSVVIVVTELVARRGFGDDEFGGIGGRDT
jgi:hypothetical protein